ncbi:tetratricopeptide repeat protein [Streptomyces lydicus]|uniref:tetratricopeptide repeat protein n=1 Tax=Streptomyces lydicus TaxID=47763 RepID=UPI0037FC57CF
MRFGKDKGRPPAASQQSVRVESGVGYGVQGADVHVFGDGVPVYLLANRKPPPVSDAKFLRELPSRMLNAHFQVVDFTGRQDELAQLREWRDKESRLAVRWLHGPGGQGKTRLADQLAAECTALGWKVVTALHGPGLVWPSPSLQEDLRLTDAAGVLLIVDYADQWPLSHLTWLFSNALLHHMIPTRILLVARSANAWTPIRATLANHQVDVSTTPLRPLPDGPAGRLQMFTAARDAFAARYGLQDVAHLASPSPLEDPEMGLTLTVHMAALVAVDASAQECRPPRTPEGLTLYLLDREHLHWARLYGDGTHELTPGQRIHRTPPASMERVVFTAALTGALPRARAIQVLDSLQIAPGAEHVAADHVHCYPPLMPSPPNEPEHLSALEPLYPDRLAEDFLALTLPGHHADYPAQPWASSTIQELLTRTANGFAAPWTSRTIGFLAAAASPGRWPHIADHLNRILLDDPALAVAAGSAALTALADIPEMDPQVLEDIQLHFPSGPYPELAPGRVAVVRRTTCHLLASTSDPAEQAVLHSELAVSAGQAGWNEEALAANEKAVQIRRRLALEQAAQLPFLSRSLSDQAILLSHLGRFHDALTASEQAVRIQRRLEETRTGEACDLAYALSQHSAALVELGRLEEALAALEETVEIRSRHQETRDDRRSYAMALSNLSVVLRKLDRFRQSVEVSMSAFVIRKSLYEENPADSLPGLADSANTLGTQMLQLRWFDKAVFFGEAAVHFYRQLVHVNKDKYEPDLGDALTNLGMILAEVERHDEALAHAEESVKLHRSLASTNRAAHEPHLANALSNLGVRLSLQERMDEALAATREAVQIHQRLASDSWDAFGERYAMSLSNLGYQLAKVGERRDALDVSKEAVLCYRKLSEINGAFTSELARTLHSHARIRLHLHEEESAALQAATEAFTLYNKLTARLPEAFAAYLPATLTTVADSLSALGREAEEGHIRQCIENADFAAAAKVLAAW